MYMNLHIITEYVFIKLKYNCLYLSTHWWAWILRSYNLLAYNLSISVVGPTFKPQILPHYIHFHLDNIVQVMITSSTEQKNLLHWCVFLHRTDRRFSIFPLYNNWKLSSSSIHHLAGSCPVHLFRQLLCFAISLQRQGLAGCPGGGESLKMLRRTQLWLFWSLFHPLDEDGV